MRTVLVSLQSCLLPLIAAACVLGAAPARAQSWPSAKPITVLNPTPPGGTMDNVLRSTSEFVARRLGQQIIHDSRTGGNGVPVAQAVLSAPADGYLIGTNYVSHVVNPIAIKDLSYDAFRDFVLVTKLVEVSVVWVAPVDAPYASIPELIKYARANPTKVSFGQIGLGGNTHFAFETFRQTAGVTIELIPYRGEAQMIPDLLSGRLVLAGLTLNGARTHLESGKIKILGTISGTRLASMPNVPTIAEALPGFAASAPWYGLFMRAGTPPAIVDRIAAEYRAALADPAVKQKLDAAGLIPVGSTPAEFTASLHAESEKYTVLIPKIGFKY